jgi:hypothetical protein
MLPDDGLLRRLESHVGKFRLRVGNWQARAPAAPHALLGQNLIEGLDRAVAENNEGALGVGVGAKT